MITFATAAMAVALTTRLLARHGRTPAPDGVSQGAAIGTDVQRRYRFREGYLLSDVDADDAFLEAGIDRTVAYKRLVAALLPLSPDLKSHLSALHDRSDSFLIDGRIGNDAVLIGGRMEEDDVITLSIGPADEKEGRQTVEAATLHALKSELSDLRAALDTGVVPMWKEDESARVTWANAPYFDLVERLRDGEAPGWPLPRVFASELDANPTEGTVRRCKIAMPDRDEPTWYEVSRDLLPGGAALFTAQPADRLVRAESSLRQFLQTTTKTFAALPVGLAVFDRKRQLVTFNPALVALTQAGAEFLSARPDLRSFLDQLREKKRMPEPRDYRSWRDEIAQLEEDAENGTYRQLWELPEGKTFRVMGRPHPDGAIAFMFEDISAEVTLTRQFRADLEMFQAVLDAIPAAIAVFQADGAMIGANEGYGRLWGQDPQILAQMPHLNQACQEWADGCKPSSVWGDIRQFVGHEVERAPWVEVVETKAGIRLAVRMAPTRGRATVVQFLPLDVSLSDPLAELAPDTVTPLLDAARSQVPDDTKRRA
ncbi:PAS-domain containing protein [Rhodobacteraceae bacterium M385]|nr:PAS-domain containing protein [Rhodobacteraceae bacterium M385]